MDFNKIKNYIILVLFLVAGVEGFILWCRQPDIKKEVKTVESQYWLQQYNTLQKNYKSDLAKNVHTVIITHNNYDPAGHLTDQTISSDTLDLSTLTESYNELSTTLVSLQAKIKSLETITYSKPDWALTVNGSLPLSLPLLPQLDSVFIYRRIIFDLFLGAGYCRPGVGFGILGFF